MPSPLENLRWHLKHQAWLYYSFAIAFAIIGTVVLLGSLVPSSRGKKEEEIRSRPSVDALVLKSKLREINTSDEYSFSTKLSLSARFRYTLSGCTFESDYLGSWNRSDNRDWSQIFTVGQTVTIRVSPSDPSDISLIDLTGTP
jgi:hypothetical protein